ncbi:MAG: hypothetical protein AMS18_08575 [Gemmatimonas sp. SG8_17]|nr:MAG: hypothetical protein AMS18_08575 [Gemmatimonas sp. SG8_17]
MRRHYATRNGLRRRTTFPRRFRSPPTARRACEPWFTSIAASTRKRWRPWKRSRGASESNGCT